MRREHCDFERGLFPVPAPGYRLTRLIDRYGAAMGLPKLKGILTETCPKRDSLAHFNVCGCHFTDLKPWKTGQGFGSK